MRPVENASPDEEAMVREFLGNLFDLGRLSSFEELKSVEKPILAGKITRIYPFKSNKIVSGPHMMVFRLVEVTHNEKRREFQVFFVDEAAKVVAEAELCRKDYVAILKPRLFRNSTFSHSLTVSFNAVLHVGTRCGNSIGDVYCKRGLTDDWHAVRKKLCPKRKLHVAFSEDDEVLPINNDEQPKVDLYANPRPSTSTDTSTDWPRYNCSPPFRSGKKRQNTPIISDDDDTDDDADTVVSERRDDDEAPAPRLSPVVDPCATPRENLARRGCTVSRAFLNKAVRKEPIGSPLNTENVRLKDVRANMKVAVFGVITCSGKSPTMTVDNKYYTRIEIADETNSRFPVNIYTRAVEIMPTLRQYDIVKLTNMKIDISREQLYGKVSFARNIVTYSREDPAIIFQQSQSYECSSQDRQRVEELIEWMQEKLPEARMFTLICDIKTISTHINLNGRVVKVKSFENSPNIVLRFRDDSRTRIPFYACDLTKDYLGREESMSSKDSDFVDIIIVEADRTFRRRIESLKEGAAIKLYNVKVKPMSYMYKATTCHAAQLFFKAVHENMKTVHEPDDCTEIENVTSEDSVAENMRTPPRNNASTAYHKCMEIQKSMETSSNSNPSKNLVEMECLEEWPTNVEGEFWFKGSWISMIPVISNTSSDLDILSLISAHCEQCHTSIPFFFASEWIQNNDGFFNLCSFCKKRGRKVHLRHEMTANLLLGDCHKKSAQALAVASVAEKFFGCTALELIKSKEIRFRVRNFVSTTKVLALKLKISKTSKKGSTYVVLDTGGM